MQDASLFIGLTGQNPQSRSKDGAVEGFEASQTQTGPRQKPFFDIYNQGEAPQNLPQTSGKEDSGSTLTSPQGAIEGATKDAIKAVPTDGALTLNAEETKLLNRLPEKAAVEPTHVALLDRSDKVSKSLSDAVSAKQSGADMALGQQDPAPRQAQAQAFFTVAGVAPAARAENAPVTAAAVDPVPNSARRQNLNSAETIPSVQSSTGFETVKVDPSVQSRATPEYIKTAGTERSALSSHSLNPAERFAHLNGREINASLAAAQSASQDRTQSIDLATLAQASAPIPTLTDVTIEGEIRAAIQTGSTSALTDTATRETPLRGTPDYIKTAAATAEPLEAEIKGSVETIKTSAAVETIRPADTARTVQNTGPAPLIVDGETLPFRDPVMSSKNVQTARILDVNNPLISQNAPSTAVDREAATSIEDVRTAQSLEADTARPSPAAVTSLTGAPLLDAEIPVLPAGTPSTSRESEPVTLSETLFDFDLRLTSSDLRDAKLASQASSDKILLPAGASALGSIATPSGLDAATLLETPSLSLQSGSPSVLSTPSVSAMVSAMAPGTQLGPQSVPIVSEAILLAKETSKGVTVQLDPPEMGRVYIDFLFDADRQVSVVIKTETLEAQHLLRERSAEFLGLLSENGLDSANLSFEFHDGQDFEGAHEGFQLEQNINSETVEAAIAPPLMTRHTAALRQSYSDGLDLRL